jgi:putative transposase
MGTATGASFSEAPGSEPRTLAALLLESIALRHQIAVLERSRTRRTRFRLWDRLFWILFSLWWPQWRDSLIIVQPETVLRWRRDGWSALWRYRARVAGAASARGFPAKSDI